MQYLYSSSDSVLAPSEEDMELSALHHDSRQFSGEAVVDEEIRPHQRGRVYFRSSWWFARCDRELCLAPGERVEVVGLETDDLTLLVLPYAETETEIECNPPLKPAA